MLDHIKSLLASAVQKFSSLRTIPLLVLLTTLFGCGEASDLEGSDPNAATTSEAITAVYSDLWGVSGELWTPQSRLPDFSFAGYRTGTSPLPTPAVVANVKNFGAVGDGVADDTQAFLNAIAATSNGALSIPAGRYKITKVLKISKSNLVLRGAGAGTTTLYFTKSLTDILGPAPAFAGPSGFWSWAGGLVWFDGKDNGTKLANVTGTALRGAKTITVDSSAGLSVGMTIRVTEYNNDGSLGLYLHDGQAGAGSDAPIKLVDFAVKITAISGNTLTLERPLRADIKQNWLPQIYAFAPAVQESGIEDLTIEFPNTSYPGHHAEKGYNGIYLDTVANCWIKNITILDADSGVLSESETDGISRFCTIDNVHLANQWRPSTGVTGHHGIALEGPQDMLVTHFAIDRQFFHDLTVDNASCGNVFSSGHGVNMNFDHHRYVNYENLFTDIDAGVGDTLWWGSRNQDSGNAATGGPPASVRETLWGIRASNAMSLPNWPLFNVVGMTKFATQKTGNLWVEQIDPAALSPTNLHLAQLALRQGGPPAPVLTSILVTPGTATLIPSATQQFSASGYDQFGSLVSPQPAFGWSVSGGGTISGSGLFTAGASAGGPFTVTATSSAKSGTASVTIGSGSTAVKINFQTSSTATPSGYLADVGLAFADRGNGYSYGWSSDNTGQARERNAANSPDKRYDTFNQLQRPANPNASWEIAVPNGTYSLHIVAGDPSYFDSVHKINAENTLAISGTPSSAQPWIDSTVSVTVSDGRLTLSNASGSSNNKVNFIELTSTGGGPANQAPTVATAAAASPSTVTGTGTNLSVLGADDAGEASLKYTWTTTGSPPAPVSFSANGTNAAKSSTVSFSKAGTYGLTVTIADAGSLTATSNTTVTVNQSTTSVAVLPANATISPSTTQQFSATASDQFGTALSPQPSFSWTVSGGGTISAGGLFSAGSVAGGPFTVTATGGGKSGNASVTISGSGGSVTLGALADAFVRDGVNASTNYGSALDLQAKNHLTDWSRVTFLKFDLASVSSPITSVKLRLYGYINGTDPLTIQTFGVSNTSFVESSLTWNNQPSIGASILAGLVISSATAQWYEWDITAYAQAEKSAGRNLIALALKSATYSATFADFVSREGGANAPKLVIVTGS